MSPARRLIAAALVLVLATAAAACAASPDVAATVDGVDVSAAEVATVAGIFRMLGDVNGSGCGTPVEGETAEAACARFALSNLIRIRIAQAWAADNEVTVPESDVQDTVTRLDQDLAPDGLDATAASYDVTREDVADLARGLLLFNAVRVAVAEQQISEDDLRAAYDASTDFTQIHAKHILVADRATADEVFAQATPENFGALAERYSTDPGSAANGGDLGSIVQSSLDATFAEAALALQPGEIGPPVKTQFGWHVILLVEVFRTPYEQARASILQAKAGDLFAVWLPDDPVTDAAASAPASRSGAALLELVRTMARLRGPDGCPWDREQTHASLARHLLEETHEALDAIERGDPDLLRDELGDVLLQVVFHAQMAAEAGDFDVDDVAEAIVRKLVRRHPHVFGEAEVSGADEVLVNWERIKEEERGRIAVDDDIPASLPALARAAKVQRRAAGIGFEYRTAGAAFAQVREELAELEAAATTDDTDHVEAELGDVLFATVAAARVLGVDAEQALRRATATFSRRYERFRDVVEERGLDLDALDEAAIRALFRESRDPRHP